MQQLLTSSMRAAAKANRDCLETGWSLHTCILYMKQLDAINGWRMLWTDILVKGLWGDEHNQWWTNSQTWFCHWDDVQEDRRSYETTCKTWDIAEMRSVVSPRWNISSCITNKITSPNQPNIWMPLCNNVSWHFFRGWGGVIIGDSLAISRQSNCRQLSHFAICRQSKYRLSIYRLSTFLPPQNINILYNGLLCS